MKLPKLRQKGNAFYFDVGGKPRRWIPLGCDPVDAMRQYKRLMGAKSAGGTVGKMLDDHLLAIVRDVKPSSLAQYRAWRDHLHRVFGGMPMDSVTQFDILKYLDVCPRTSGPGEMSLLSQAFTRAMRAGLVTFNPCVGVKSGRRRPKRDRYIEDRELLSILEHASPQLLVAIDLAYATGLRVSDMVALRWDQFDDGGIIRAKKNGNRQRFTVTEDLRAILDRAKALQGAVASMYVLCGRGRQPVARQTLGGWWREASAKAGVKDAHWHDLRAKAGTDVDAQGGNATEFLGHTNKRTTEVYLRGKSITTVTPLKRRM